jgi:hypothetical protein
MVLFFFVLIEIENFQSNIIIDCGVFESFVLTRLEELKINFLINILVSISYVLFESFALTFYFSFYILKCNSLSLLLSFSLFFFPFVQSIQILCFILFNENVGGLLTLHFKKKNHIILVSVGNILFN